MLPFEFHLKLKRKDLFSFKMYEVIHSFQGLMAFVFFLMLLFIVIATFGKIGLIFSVLYLFSAIIVIAYFPLIMFLQAGNEVKNLKKYKYPFDFFLSNDGLRLKQEKFENERHSEDDSENKPKIEFVSWDKVFRVKETMGYFYIFTGRDAAFILPKAVVLDDADGVRKFFLDRLPKEKVKIKRS